MSSTASAPSSSDETLRCARHPNVETVLRCGRCETPICPKCLIATPVGARCPTCAQVKRFAFLIKPREFARAIPLGIAAGAIGTIIAINIPFLGPLLGFMIVGFVVGEAVSVGVNRKRARELGPVAVACLLVGYWLALVALTVFVRGRPLSTDVLAAPVLALFNNLLLLVGVGVGALLAWMRVR